MNLYKTAPQKERKARDEIRRARIKALLPMEERTNRRMHPVAPGYIFADAKPTDSRYVRECLGQIDRGAIAPLYTRRRAAKPQPERPFKKGDRVTASLSTGNKSGVIEQTRGRVVIVLFDGAVHTVSISTTRVALESVAKTGQ